MSRTNAMETTYLQHYFQNTNHANIGDATGLRSSIADGSFYISLHTGDPGETGNQTTNEATFGAYARQAVARTAAGWAVSANTADNVAAITFPEATSGSETITHVGIGSALSGVGNLFWFGTLDTSRLVTAGVTLQFAIGALNVVAD